MELLEERFILELKSRFFDIISTDNNLFQYESMAEKMILTIKTLLHAEEVTLYQYNESKQQILVEASTNEEMRQKQTIVDFSSEEREAMALCNRVSRKPAHIHAFEQYDLLIPIKLSGEIQNYLLLKEEDSFMSQLPETDS